MAKTDQLDAQDIAFYGETMKPEPTELKPAKLRLLSDLLAVRSQCLDREYDAEESVTTYA